MLSDTSDTASDVVVHDVGFLLSSPGRDFLLRNNGQRVHIDSILERGRGYRLVLLFSASWCISSQLFFLLKKEKYQDEQDVFIFVSLDKDVESFRTHFSLMPWLAVPFSDSHKRSWLVQLFKVTDIPHLVELDGDGRILTMGLEGIQLPLLRESYPCPLESLKLLKVQRDADLRNQSLRSLLVHGLYNYVLSSEGSRIPVSKLEGKIVGLYFSYPLVTAGSVQFHKRLVDVHEELNKNGDNFEIVSLHPSADANVLMGYLENFLILPMNYNRFSELVHRFELKNLPAVVIIGSDGETLNLDAADAIKEHGAAAYPFTMEKLAEIGWEVVGENEAVWRKHSLRSALALHASLEFVISSDGSRLPVSVLQGKVLGIYFAHPSRSCVEFTLDLLDVYRKLNTVWEKFEVLLVYLQRNASNYDKEHFSRSFGILPWLMLESSIATSEELASYFKVSFVPSLVIIGKDGNILNFNAVHLIREYGVKAYPFTPEKLVQVANVEEVSGEIRDARSLWPKKLKHDRQLVPRGTMMYRCNSCSKYGAVWSYYCNFSYHCQCALTNASLSIGKERSVVISFLLLFFVLLTIYVQFFTNYGSLKLAYIEVGTVSDFPFVKVSFSLSNREMSFIGEY